MHRQTAASAVKHMSLGVTGLGCEDALTHLLNFVWPNIFETSPHVITAVMEAIDGLRCALGPTVVLQYATQGLFHPARKVREVYWKIYNNLCIHFHSFNIFILFSLFPHFPPLLILEHFETLGRRTRWYQHGHVLRTISTIPTAGGN